MVQLVFGVYLFGDHDRRGVIRVQEVHVIALKIIQGDFVIKSFMGDAECWLFYLDRGFSSPRSQALWQLGIELAQLPR